MKTERIRTDLEKARRRAAEWQARARDLERQLTEQENMEIVQAVRSISASPEELEGILGRIRSMKPLGDVPGAAPQEQEREPENNIVKEETDQHEEEII